MNDTNTHVATREQNAPATAEAQRAETITLRPATDIHETKEGVTLYIDMPGVPKDALSIDVDQNVLSVKGAINLHTPEGLEPTYMDVHSGTFERHFTLGEQLDTQSISAELDQGVLKLSIPRSEQHKPRKIEVKVA
ncbi:MAG TPA: Hsp20/alpha crystallin family protein [Gammaproteobacteria bacterium]|nr:Hsp20/alpha crystallin family protein [Gammaproteobacteria bacterium]